MELKVIQCMIVCSVVANVLAQTCPLICGPGQICEYVGFNPTCVQMNQGGFFPPGRGRGLGLGRARNFGVGGHPGRGRGLNNQNVGMVNPGGFRPGVVDNRSGQVILNLTVQNTNINQHDSSGGGGTQVNQQPGVLVPF